MAALALIPLLNTPEAPPTCPLALRSEANKTLARNSPIVPFIFAEASSPLLIRALAPPCIRALLSSPLWKIPLVPAIAAEALTPLGKTPDAAPPPEKSATLVLLHEQLYAVS